MPIGKNSIKRVSNNGYSQVATSAPDMENSTVLANPAPEVVEMVAPKKKPVAKKPVAKKPAAKKPAPTTEAPAEAAPVSDFTPEPEIEAEDGFKSFSLGTDLPYYLL